MVIFCITGLFVISGVVVYFSTKGDYHLPKTVEHDKSLPRFEIGNKLFHGEVFGNEGQAVVIVLHGGPGNDYKMLLPLENLSDGYRVVFYDQRGAGLSPRVPVEQLTLDGYIEDLDDIANHFSKGKKVNLIGHSWGAMLATAYISRYPQKVDRAVLAEPGILTNESYKVFMEKVMGEPDLNFILHFFKSKIKSLHVSKPDRFAQKDFFYTEALLEYTEKDNPMAGYYCNNQPPKMPYWRFGGHASESIRSEAYNENGELNMNLAEGMKNFKNKILILTGECNKLIGTEFQKKYHLSLFNNVRLHEIKNSGHLMFSEQPKKSVQVVREFLNN